MISIRGVLGVEALVLAVATQILSLELWLVFASIGHSDYRLGLREVKQVVGFLSSTVECQVNKCDSRDD